MKHLIETKQLSRVFGSGNTLVSALQGIDLEVQQGEFTAIVGPSGSGKTTLLQHLSGLDQPSSGEIWLAGQSLSTMKASTLTDFRRDHLGFVFQAYNLIPVLSAEENIEYIMLLQGVSSAERKRKVRSIMASLGLEGLAHRRPAELSGGQQQRVAVARAVVSEPDLVFADEPTANIDSQQGHDLLSMMQTLNKEKGVTFLFATHDPKVMACAKRIIHLEDGKIISDETKC